MQHVYRKSKNTIRKLKTQIKKCFFSKRIAVKKENSFSLLKSESLFPAKLILYYIKLFAIWKSAKSAKELFHCIKKYSISKQMKQNKNP